MSAARMSGPGLVSEQRAARAGTGASLRGCRLLASAGGLCARASVRAPVRPSVRARVRACVRAL